MIKLDDYTLIIGESAINELRLLAMSLRGKTIQHVNSAKVGGGVAEILNRLIPLAQDLELDIRWDVIKGDNGFFQVTKKFHNALHGHPEKITKNDFEIFMATGQKNIKEFEITGDIVFIHDPQPITLIKTKSSHPKRKWAWRCHIDISRANEKVWKFLRQFVVKYDATVFHSAIFTRNLPNKQFLIPPSIDPLSDKNKELSPEYINQVMAKHKIPRDKPIISQFSRYDYMKDPIGVIETYRLVKKYHDCRLILSGGAASDDPEGAKILADTKERAGHDPDIHLLLMPPGTDTEVNALQRGSDIIIQKSLREGFALSVTEALWKSKPVVASAVGGIPLQVIDGYSGLLCHSIEGAAFKIKELLSNPDYARQLGKNAREHVRQNFLLTRHLRNHLLLFLSLYHDSNMIQLTHQA